MPSTDQVLQLKTCLALQVTPVPLGDVLSLP